MLIDQTYRFAITFYDTQGRALFARWIGDIRMPDYGDTNPNPDALATAAGITADFRLSFEGTASIDGGASTSWLNILYPKFTVTIPTDLRQYIGGYRICRVERTKDDKTILGAGLVTQMLSSGAGFFIPSHHTSNPYVTASLNLDSGGTAAGGYPQYHFMFDSPEFLLTGYPGFTSGDALSIAQRLDRSNTIVDTTPGTETEPYRIAKYYDIDANYGFSTSAFPVSEAGEVSYGKTKSFTNTSFIFNNYSYSDITSRVPSVGSKTLALSIDNALEYSAGAYVCTLANYKKLYALYYRTVANQYGGNSYSSRTRNEYIPCGSLQPINTDITGTTFTHQVFGGDIFLDIYDNQKLIKNYTAISGYTNSSGVGVAANSFSYFFPCESSHNFNLRHGIHINKDLWANLGAGGPGGSTVGAAAYETYDYNIVYSSENSVRTYITKPLDFVAVEENDTRTWFSEEKQDGESKDSWTQFKPANYYDADNYYGPINAILTFKDKIFFLQDRGFGVIPFNDRTLLSTGSIDATTETNIGRPLEVIGRPEYISKTAGSKHQWGVTTSDNALYFFDINSKQLFQYSGQGFGAIPGVDSYFKQNLVGSIFTKDNPVYSSTTAPRAGINCTVDFPNHDVLFSFFDFSQTDGGFLGQGSKRRFTIAYNEKFKCFTSFYSFTPALYINDRKHIITPYTKDPTSIGEATTLNQLYMHEVGNKATFYGTIYDSTLKVLVNPYPNKSKIYQNLKWFTQSINTSDVNLLTDTWKSARVYNDSQNTDYQTLTPNLNIKRKERGWRFGVPRNRVKATGSNLNIFTPANLDATRLFKEPIRDVYGTVDLKYSNTDNNRLICPFLTTEYLISPR